MYRATGSSELGEKRPLGRPKPTMEDNIKMDRGERKW